MYVAVECTKNNNHRMFLGGGNRFFLGGGGRKRVNEPFVILMRRMCTNIKYHLEMTQGDLLFHNKFQTYKDKKEMPYLH